MNRFANKEFLITGGTGSLGKTLVKKLKTEYDVRGIRIYSRDELKQWQFKNELDSLNLSENVAFLIGDVREQKRLEMAMSGVDYVINCAAMKQVPACENNPLEAIRTNIHGAENVLNAAINCKVEKVMHISTDKAVYPVNLYGATKTVAEKLFIHGNTYSGENNTKFSCCRYGNVIGSRGSVIPVFKEQAKSGKITITDRNMTRFWIKLDNVANFIFRNIEKMKGAEIFVPKMKSSSIVTLANAICPGTLLEEIGIRHGEKINECLISREESKYVEICDDYFVIHPNIQFTSDEWEYTSNSNPAFIKYAVQLKEWITSEL